MLTEGKESTKIKKKAVGTGMGGGGRVLGRFIGRGGGSFGKQSWWVGSEMKV